MTDPSDPSDLIDPSEPMPPAEDEPPFEYHTGPVTLRGSGAY